MSRRALMPRTPEKILMVEAMAWIVPARVAGVPVDHPIWCRKFVARMREAADQHHRATDGPCEPRQARGKADKQWGVTQQAGQLDQRPVTGLVFRAMRDLGPHQAVAMHGLLIDADDPVAAVFQEGDDV